MALLLTNIKWSENPKPQIAKRLGCKTKEISEVVLLKKSVDGRRRPPVWLANYRVVLSIDENQFVQKKLHGVRLFGLRDQQRYENQKEQFDFPVSWPKKEKTIVVGAGPAGLFAALRLVEFGAPTILLERGGDVAQRHVDVRDFWRHRKLNKESNVVYGEGGAGAFSDGKIYTRRRDGELGWVFKKLVDFGADPEILKEGWAHLGTDKIRQILPEIRKYILEKGGEIRFNTKVEQLKTEQGRCTGVILSDGQEILGTTVIMATGHSARDSWRMMIDAGAHAIPRPIRIGARVEHPQKLIDMGRYGSPRGELPPASYRFVSHPPNEQYRSAHTFCMCPGGTVVGATNDENRIVVNGMSYSGRKAWWANSAIIVELGLEDYEQQDPFAGVRIQDKIEEKAFQMGGGDFRAPAQRVTDFLNKTESLDLPRTSYPQGITPANLWNLFPKTISEGIAQALLHFDKKIPGFAGEEGILIAPETRTTAPLRFTRNEQMESTTLSNLMPIGEGAGYAGGISSAALEGFRSAQILAKRHKAS